MLTPFSIGLVSHFRAFGSVGFCSTALMIEGPTLAVWPPSSFSSRAPRLSGPSAGGRWSGAPPNRRPTLRHSGRERHHPLGVKSKYREGLEEGLALRNILMAGTAGLFIVLGAGYANADNCDVPYNSPYRTMGAYSAYCGDYGYPNGPMVEGRSAYVDPDYDAYPYDAYPDGGFYVGGWGWRHGHYHR